MNKRQYFEWTDIELEFLKNNYKQLGHEEIIKKLRGRSWEAIRKKANIIGSYRDSKRLSDASVLLEDNPISYYWIGLLMADGCFTDRRIALGLCNKDAIHLLKYKQFIRSNNKMHKISDQYSQVRVTNAKVVRSLKNKFGITSRKTYEPCNIQSIKNDELLFSLIVGIIDGDGSIYRCKQFQSYRMAISMHPSWYHNLLYIEKFLYSYFNIKKKTFSTKIRNHNTYMPQDKTRTKKIYKIANMYICRYNLLLKIKEKADQLNLPFMDRKFGKIQIKNVVKNKQ